MGLRRRRKIGLFLLCLTAGSSPSAFASLSKDQCSTVNLNKKLGPIQFQKRSKWCFAYTGATLINNALGISGKKGVSVPDIVQAYYSPVQHIKLGLYSARTRAQITNNKTAVDNPSTLLMGDGYMDAAVEIYGAQGTYCTEKQLPVGADDDEIRQREWDFLRANYLGDLSKALGEFSEEKDFDTVGDVLRRCRVDPLKTFYEQFQEIAPIADLALRKEFAQACKPRTPMPKLQPVTIPVSARKIFAPEEEIIHPKSEAMDRIGQNFKDGKVTGLSFLRADLGGANDPNAEHAVILAGRKWNKKKNTCEFLIRDTANIGCNGFSDPDIFSCVSDGLYYVSTDLVEKSMTAVTYIK